jgi:hypothetical protein
MIRISSEVSFGTNNAMKIRRLCLHIFLFRETQAIHIFSNINTNSGHRYEAMNVSIKPYPTFSIPSGTFPAGSSLKLSFRIKEHDLRPELLKFMFYTFCNETPKSAPFFAFVNA